MIKAIVMAVIYSGLYVWMRIYRSKTNNNVDKGEGRYAITLPNLLKNVYTVMFAFGLFLTVVFTVCYYRKLAGATMGHIIFAAVFATIGLIVMFICVRWRIDVDGERFTIHYAFKPAKSYSFQDVDKVIIGSKGEMAIYVNGKKVRTIDALAINREIIEEKFESDGKVEYDV